MLLQNCPSRGMFLAPSYKHVTCLFMFIVEVRPQCYTNNDCQITEACHLGSCVDACRLTNCGTNARCISQNHQGQCVCLSGYEGNPSFACNPGNAPSSPFALLMSSRVDAYIEHNLCRAIIKDCLYLQLTKLVKLHKMLLY